MKYIEKPWGSETILYTDERFTCKQLFMKGGHKCSLQYHEKKIEFVSVVNGTLRLYIGQSPDDLEIREMQPGDFVLIEPGVVHRMEGITDVIYTEASTSELDDVVRLQDVYGRK